MLQILKIPTRTACTKAAIDAPKSLSQVIYCVNHVKKFDRENYLAAIFIDDVKMKRVVFALRAFNVELALIRDSTTNSDRAKIRFHFWSKLVDEIIKRNDSQDFNLDKLDAYYNYAPVAKELLDLFYLVEMDVAMKQRLKDLIGSRISSKVLGYQSFKTMNELELYCAKSNSPIYHLSWEMTQQVRNSWNDSESVVESLTSVSETMGVAHGLSNVIRSIRYNSTKNCCYVPDDIQKEFSLTSRDFIGKNFDGKKVAPAIKKLTDRCQELMDSSYRKQKEIPNYFRQLYLPRIAIQASLNRLAKCKYDLSDPHLSSQNGLLPLNLWMAKNYHGAPIL